MLRPATILRSKPDKTAIDSKNRYRLLSDSVSDYFSRRIHEIFIAKKYG